MEHVITESPYLCSPNILWHPGCQTKAVALDFAGTGGCIKAGSPISAAGKIANDASAVGVLLHDAHEGFCCRGLVVIGGYIKADVAEENSGIKISDAARAAMSRLAFIGADGVPGGHPQSDWNQNDYTQPDYVKNRPFYTGDPVETVLVEESTVSFADKGGMYAASFPSTFEATVGETYKVYWDGTGYECVCVDFNGYITIGNLSVTGAGSDTGEPFLMLVVTGSGIQIYTADTSASHTFSISAFDQEVVKIDEKYLPESAFTNAEWSNISNKIVDYKQQSLSLSASGEPITIIAGVNYSDNRINDNLKFEDGMVYEINGNITLYNTKYKIECPLDINGSYICSNGYVVLGSCYDNYFDKYIGVRLYSSSSSDDTFNYGKLVADTTISGSTEYTFDINITVTAEARRLPDICIGENIQRVGDDVIIQSSTPDSTKKFKITVDDSGTISATEAT